MNLGCLCLVCSCGGCGFVGFGGAACLLGVVWGGSLGGLVLGVLFWSWEFGVDSVLVFNVGF